MRTGRIAALAALVIVGAACSSPSASEDLSVSVDEASGTIAIETGDATTTSEPTVLVGDSDGEPADGVPEIPEVPDELVPVEGEVDGEGVLIAAIVVATGDVEAALDQGVITPAEVEAAIGAIADGTLSEWVAQ